MDALEVLKDQILIPVVVIKDKHHAVDLALSLRDAGIGAIEITLRSDAALDAIEMVAEQVPDIIVGAGSVRNPEQLIAIVNAGAKFAVCPGASQTLLAGAKQHKIPFVPGAVTASEIIRNMEAGYVLQKFFPAQLSGGIAMLKALSAPLPEVRFFPTGGIDAQLAREYLALTCVQCVGGSWFVPDNLVVEKRFAEVQQLASGALSSIHG